MVLLVGCGLIPSIAHGQENARPGAVDEKFRIIVDNLRNRANDWVMAEGHGEKIAALGVQHRAV